MIFFLDLIILYACWSFAISRKLVIDKNISFQKMQFAEDASFVIKVLLLMESILINRNEFLYHRSRRKSLHRTLGVEAAYAWFLILIDVCRLFKIYSQNNL